MASSMNSGKSSRSQDGFTYLAMLLAVAVIGVGLAATGIVWSQSRQREYEQELLFIGNQFRQAIALYYRRTSGAAKRYPAKLEDLLEDKRYATTQRYLRKIYVDPMTGKSEWGLVKAPDGGIMGVYSLSKTAPIKSRRFAVRDQAFEGAATYSEWLFFYAPPTGAGQSTPLHSKSGADKSCFPCVSCNHRALGHMHLHLSTNCSTFDKDLT
jgi:type II secretory pathway pseudopilin PulG